MSDYLQQEYFSGMQPSRAGGAVLNLRKIVTMHQAPEKEKASN